MRSCGDENASAGRSKATRLQRFSLLLLLSEDTMVEDHIQCVVQDVRDTVKGALKDGLEAVEKALQDGRKAVKRAHNDVPVYHDSRLGGLIDDSWTVVRLLEASLVDDLGPLKQSIPGCVGKLGSLNLPANAKELKLVQSAAQRFLSLMQQTCEVCPEKNHCQSLRCAHISMR